MFATAFDKILVTLWGNHRDPDSFFALVENAAPVTERAAFNWTNTDFSRKVRFAVEHLSDDWRDQNYGYFDLMRDMGQIPGASAPRPANDNWRAAA